MSNSCYSTLISIEIGYLGYCQFMPDIIAQVANACEVTIEDYKIPV